MIFNMKLAAGENFIYLHRVNACKEHHLDKNFSDPRDVNSSSVHQVTVSYPEQGWRPITQAFSTPDAVPKFNTGHIVTYFVYRTVCDHLPAGNFKSINNSAENLFRCGHVQDICVCGVRRVIYIKARCFPEMKKDKLYALQMTLDSSTHDIIHAECECPAGKGSCKHIGALSFALADFCKLGSLPEFLTCTDKLQQWNHPRGRRVEPVPVDKISARRHELLPSRTSTASQLYDPRPAYLRVPDPKLLEILRCDLINQGQQPCGFLSLLIPSFDKIQHDHSYTSMEQGALPSRDPPSEDHILPDLQLEHTVPHAEEVLDSLCLNTKERLDLEKTTRLQSHSNKWFKARRCRITGSKCGRLVLQKKKTVALLQFCVYPKPMFYFPRAIAWGKTNEHRANMAYTNHMQLYGHKDLRTTSAGFVVHPEKGWLGASPDAWVEDPYCNAINGIAEFKCPYTKADVSPEEACLDKNFYCTMLNGIIQLKRDHSYYHQVQLQLYVTADVSHWCDFCVYTKRGIAVERIYTDYLWIQETLPQLDSYFFDHILPELLHPQHKPSYYY